MNIAIDFDGTIKRSSQRDSEEDDMWLHIINTFSQFGHSVYCVTARCPEMAKEILDHFDTMIFTQPVVIVACGGTPKKQKCKEEGINIDIWIDDMPESI